MDFLLIIILLRLNNTRIIIITRSSSSSSNSITITRSSSSSSTKNSPPLPPPPPKNLAINLPLLPPHPRPIGKAPNRLIALQPTLHDINPFDHAKRAFILQVVARAAVAEVAGARAALARVGLLLLLLVRDLGRRRRRVNGGGDEVGVGDGDDAASEKLAAESIFGVGGEDWEGMDWWVGGCGGDWGAGGRAGSFAGRGEGTYLRRHCVFGWGSVSNGWGGLKNTCLGFFCSGFFGELVGRVSGMGESGGELGHFGGLYTGFYEIGDGE